MFLVIENTDMTGFILSGMASGFNFADSYLKNGWMNQVAGIDIYVIRTGTFVDATLGSAVTNDGHRVFGIKNVATYASPRGMQYEEKSITLKTGKEIVVYCLIGFKLWAQKTALVVDVTLA